MSKCKKWLNGQKEEGKKHVVIVPFVLRNSTYKDKYAHAVCDIVVSMFITHVKDNKKTVNQKLSTANQG